MEYKEFRPFSDGFAVIKYQDWNIRSQNAVYVYGVVDKTGKDIQDFAKGFAVISNQNSSAIIDKQGNEIVEFGKYTTIGSFSEELAYVSRNKDESGFIDKSGNEVVPPELGYRFWTIISEELVAFQRDLKWGFARIAIE